MESPAPFHPATAARVLLVEDDPVSQQYLATVLRANRLEVDTAASAHQAIQIAQHHSHALWMIDVNLPDSTGPALLATLRRLHPQVPALAHTADNNPALADRLREAGFVDVLVKPFARQRLQDAVLPWIAPNAAPAPSLAVAEDIPLWDDSHALRALNGQADHIKALRELFLNELPTIRDVLSQPSLHDANSLRQHLHRLQASCGFVGATRLGNAARSLHAEPDNVLHRQSALEAIDALLSA